MINPRPGRRAYRRVAALIAMGLLSGCTRAALRPADAVTSPTYRLDAASSGALRFIAYGDMRFTATAETEASSSTARQALVAQVAAEAPAAVFLNGDLPWRGGAVADYEVMKTETAVWRARGLHVYPALGNHEFAQCPEERCLENWWAAFPALRGRRWYSVAVGSQLLAIALDTDTSLKARSEQRAWLEAQLASLPRAIDFVFIFLHHPPVADLQSGAGATHNPRPNELALAQYLRQAASRSRARYIVCAGHIHNYERHEQDGIVYLVSGGGGAHPVPVVRASSDLYQDPGFPNFHYLRFTLDGTHLRGEMFRLEDYEAPAPHTFALKDSFELSAKPP